MTAAREKINVDVLANAFRDIADYIAVKDAENTALLERMKRMEEALQSIKKGGDWLADLYANQDNAAVDMPFAYSKDCYRIAQAALKEGGEC